MTAHAPDSPPDRPLQVAIDVGPLYGHQTGVGTAVAGMSETLGRRTDVILDPYLVSFRSAPLAGHSKLPVPGVVASHVWSRSRLLGADRWFGGADVVHGTNYVAPPSRKPTVISVYDCWLLANPRAATPIVRRAGATLRRRIAEGAWVHASSEATATQAAQLLDTDRVRTILLGPPNLLDEGTERRPERLADGGRHPFIVCVATEERRKGLPLLIEAFEHLAGDHPDLRLVLVGAQGDDSAAVSAAIAGVAARVSDRIDRLGTVDGTHKQWLIRHAALLAYPSIDEGFGFPVLEAQALGTPVVATGVGSIAEIAGDAAHLVAGRDAETFAAALHQVLTDGAERLGMIGSGYSNVARFRWESTAEQLVRLYGDAVEAGL